MAASIEIVPDALVYVGSYTDRGGRGITLGRLSYAQGKLESVGVAAELENPSFLSVHPGHRILLAVSEVARFGEDDAGGISAWQINRNSGGLSFLNARSTGGRGPCHLAIDREGTLALVANYGDGSVASFAINEGKAIGSMTGLWRELDAGAAPNQAARPHAHGVFLSEMEDYVLVPDLGADHLRIYGLDREARAFAGWPPVIVPVTAGLGPRHFVFHPNGRLGYLLCEMSSTIVAYRCASSSNLEALCAYSTLARGFLGSNQAAEIVLDRSGTFLYSSNRGVDEIVVFSVNRDGSLTFHQRISSGGRTPRHFALDPSESFVLIANQDSDQVAVFSRDGGTGWLADTGQRMAVKQPTCVAFAA